jgi:hypothetical protein
MYIVVRIFCLMLVLFYIYITRLTSKEIFSPSNKIHREVGRARNLTAPLYRSTVSHYTRPHYYELINQIFISFSLTNKT